MLPEYSISGSGANRVLILGEILEESRAHSVLQRAIRRLGTNLESFLMVQPPAVNGMTWARAHLNGIIEKEKPRCILALDDPTKAQSCVAMVTGEMQPIKLVEGYTLPSTSGVTVVPSFHPAFLRAGHMSNFGCLLRDIGLAIEVAREGRQPSIAPAEPPPGYILYPTEAEAWDFLLDPEFSRDASVPIAYDIETPYSKKATEEAAEEDAASPILSIQFSLAPGTGIFFPWRQPFIEIAKRILALPNPKLGWNNWRFDDPRLTSNGIAIGGINHDLMWCWHHLQPDLPRGLQFAAKFFGWPFHWKHLAGSRPEHYGIIDCDVLQTIAPPLFRALKDAGIWRGYQKHILELEPILSKMSARGVPISSSRYAEVEAELKRRVKHGVEDMQALVPTEAKVVKTFKKKPPKVLEWKPSNVGLQRYVKAMAHPMPTDWKTKKITFDYMHLRRLHANTKDPLYRSILDYREAATLLNNHIKNWRPLSDSRVHSTFYYDPATGQLSSRRPNIQNAPKHKDEGLFRSIVRAEEGKVLIEADFKSFHAITLGFESQDRDYIHLSRLDIHSYVTAFLLKLGGREGLHKLPDDELASRLAAIKREHKFVRDYKAKRAILGYGFGLGWKKLYEMHKEDFSSQSEAKQLMALLDGLFPKCKKWRDAVRVRAHEQGYLISRHGYVRRFWEVLKWEHGRGLVQGGEESEAAIAFLPANDAFGTIKDAILEMDTKGLLERYGFCNTVHDSLLFECPKTLAEECIATIRPIMEAPSKILVDPVVAPDGLACEVSFSVSKSWDRMEEVKREAPFVY
jgi:DNA polymerase I-like protein with 3'-5' exonuclease and polymerase domains